MTTEIYKINLVSAQTTIANPTIGTHSFKAIYQGDATYQGSTSVLISENVTANQPANRPTGLVAYYTATNGLYKDSSFTTTATNEGDAIQGWIDLVGNFNLTKDPTLNAPTLNLTAFNNKPGVKFGNIIALKNDSFNSLSNVSAYTIFAVVSIGIDDIHNSIISVNGDAALLYFGDQVEYFWVGSAQGTISGSRSRACQIVVCRFDGSQTTNKASVWLNQTPQTITFTSNVPPTTPAGSGLFIGRYCLGSNFISGNIHEMGFYNKALSDAEINSLITSLASDWNSGPIPSIIFEGDSLTEGFPDSFARNKDYPHQVQSLLNTWTIVNQGYPGRQISEMLSSQDMRILFYRQPSRTHDYIVVWGGINDIANFVPATTVYQNLKTYCTNAKTKGFKIAVCTLIIAGTLQQDSRETERQKLNMMLRSDFNLPTSNNNLFLPNYGITWADMLFDYASDSRLDSTGAYNNTTYYTPDLVHLTDAGYGIVASIANNGILLLSQLETLSSSSINLTTDINPSIHNQQITLTSTASGNNGTPTGQVDFLDSFTVLDTKTLVSGVATTTISNLSAGTHTLTAVYKGNTVYAPSISSAVSEVINKLPTTTILAVDYNNNIITLTANVSVNSGIPTGQIVFMDGSNIISTQTL